MKNAALALVHVRCVTCRSAVTLHFRNWPEQTEDSQQEWDCPHCRTANVGTFRGQFVRAMPWYEPDPGS
ncbi:MAG TPA: hypothetical protein VLT86_16590 [Vicinamibacterales bacterium]|nr:hypothetical protein [Vicinamibacterales bacterium]